MENKIKRHNLIERRHYNAGNELELDDDWTKLTLAQRFSAQSLTKSYKFFEIIF